MYQKGDLLWDSSKQQVVESYGENRVQDGTNVATGIPLTDDLLKEMFNADFDSLSVAIIDENTKLKKEVLGYSVNGKELHYLHELQHELENMGLHKPIDKNKLADYLRTLPK